MFFYFFRYKENNIKCLHSSDKHVPNRYNRKIAKSVYEGELFIPNSTPISSISTEDDHSVKLNDIEDLIGAKSPENENTSLYSSNSSYEYLPLSTDENLYEFIAYKQTKYAVSYRTKLSIKFNTYNKSYVQNKSLTT